MTPARTVAHRNKSRVAVLPSKTLKQLRSRLKAVGDLLSGDPLTRVKSFLVAPPIQDRAIAALEPSDGPDDDLEFFPEDLKEAAKAFDGAVLVWQMRGHGTATGGGIQLPTLAEHQQQKTHGICEAGLAWPVILGTDFSDVVLVEGGSILLIGKYDGYWKGNGPDFVELVNCALDHLGISGWELSLYQDGADDDEEALVRCRETAAAVWTRIARTVPPCLRD